MKKRDRDYTGRIGGGTTTQHHQAVRAARKRADAGETAPVFFAWFDGIDDKMRVTSHAVLWRNDKLGNLMLADPHPQTVAKRFDIKDVDFTPDAAIERFIRNTDENAARFQRQADRARTSSKLARDLLVKTREDALAAARTMSEVRSIADATLDRLDTSLNAMEKKK